MKALIAALALALVCLSNPAHALPTTPDCSGPAAICDTGGAMALIRGGVPVAVRLDGPQDAGVERAAANVRADLSRLAGGTAAEPPGVQMAEPPGGRKAAGDTDAIILVGVLGSSPLIDAAVAGGRLDVSAVRGRWDGFIVQVVDNPVPGITRAIIVAGADRRGAIFGLYDLIQRAGVSPWAWWADVPVPVRPDLYVTAGARVEVPGVKYRGIFLNDENPALLGWANATFGGFNQRFYERVFDLILRLKGNYLWPAMWGKAFADDDPQNAALADRMGVVIGTSHHEPMMRAHIEWQRYGSGPWNYRTNQDRLRQFWRDGIMRMGHHESLITIGMRGDGDEAMEEGTAIDLMQNIVKDQRAIIEQVTGKNAAQVPQVWALYKEVQDYYDQGMKVPDDVTLLFADDNWGNIRRLPKPGSTRPGGYGVYYHYDYVGGPRNYKWLNTNQIERVWEQMTLAAEYGADRLWIVNVGDLKPMEFPIEFFLDMAWNPRAMDIQRLSDYPRAWAAAQFGAQHAGAIASLLTGYTSLNARRKPELLSPETFSLIHQDEAARVLSEWDRLEVLARQVEGQIRPDQRDAYVQLVLHPVLASANLTRLYITVARNRLAADQGRAETNDLAAAAEALFARDRAIRDLYERDIAGGKWTQMMSQTHIGYTGWQQPDADVMPVVRRLDPVPGQGPVGAKVGLMVAGDARGHTGAGARLTIHRHDPVPAWVALYATGKAPAPYRLTMDAPWLSVVGAGQGTLKGDSRRVTLRVDWDRLPVGNHETRLTLQAADGATIPVVITARNPGPDRAAPVLALAAADGRRIDGAGVTWQVIPHLGRDGAAITMRPGTAPAATPGGDGMRLEYDVFLDQPGTVDLRVAVSPALDFKAQGGLRYAISIDGEEPQIVNLHTDSSEKAWDKVVADNLRTGTTRHIVTTQGRHTVKLWRVDTGLAFQRVEVRREPVGEGYLGVPVGR